MEKYNYYDAVREDVRAWIEENGEKFAKANGWDKDTDRDEVEQALNDELWACDRVTGNGSGSYTFSSWQAEEYLCHNLDLLAEAVEEFGSDLDILKNGAEACDVAIRCYLLPQAIAEVLAECEIG